MDIEKELENLRRAIMELPEEIRDIVCEDVVDAGKERVRVMKRIIERR